LFRLLPVSVSTRSLWDVSERPHYLLGVISAARRALRDGVPAVSVIEFGVAGGSGLLVLEREAARVEKELGVTIEFYGFDNGVEGMPKFIGDYRDHPDKSALIRMEKRTEAGFPRLRSVRRPIRR
jgi:hypothetical protein